MKPQFEMSREGYLAARTWLKENGKLDAFNDLYPTACGFTLVYYTNTITIPPPQTVYLIPLTDGTWALSLEQPDSECGEIAYTRGAPIC